MQHCLAAIDIGSNTVHLLVAATDGHHLTVLADESIFVRMASGIWDSSPTSASLPPPMRCGICKGWQPASGQSG